MQFLTFKLSFNDYYAQDISNKIKSVKQRKIEKGEFQGGIAPYGYKKDEMQKNHLIPDLEVSHIVQEIFDMYVNKGMTTAKIADILNEKNIKPPGVYLKLPNLINDKSKDLTEYEWQHGQIIKMLRNEVYIGNVVGRKFQKISHKVDKVRATKRDEYIVVKNMHQPIIDDLTWSKAQDKLNKYSKVKTVKNEHSLKDFIYCAECGGKATYRVRRKTRKSGHVWEQKTFICSNKNIHINNCTCKPIDESIIIGKVKKVIKDEIEKIEYTDSELSTIYKQAEEKVHSKTRILENQIIKLKKKLQDKLDNIDEIYQDKRQQIITVDDFNIFYKKLQKEKNELLCEIHELEMQILAIEKDNTTIDYGRIKKLAQELLSMENPSKQLYSKLIEKIEFDSNKNITVTLTFGHIEINNELKEAI